MSVPAEHQSPDQWTGEDWDRALDARPDLVDRLHAGDVDAIIDMLNLNRRANARKAGTPE